VAGPSKVDGHHNLIVDMFNFQTKLDAADACLPTAIHFSLYRQSRTADKGWFSSLGVGRGANNFLP
jgi:hypothetical protein